MKVEIRLRSQVTYDCHWNAVHENKQVALKNFTNIRQTIKSTLLGLKYTDC